MALWGVGIWGMAGFPAPGAAATVDPSLRTWMQSADSAQTRAVWLVLVAMLYIGNR